MNDAIVFVYDSSALAGALFLMFVIRQAMNDLHIKRTDPPEVQNARKLAFFSAAAFLLLTVVFQDYWLIHPSVFTVGIVATGLVGGAIWILAVNIVSLHMRAPPSGHKTRVSALGAIAKRIRQLAQERFG